jgi:hypothetical protein
VLASGLLDELGRPLVSVSVRRPSGAILLDGQHVADTVHCVHCGGHFIMQKGSGIERGWCHNCNGMVCGRKCATCMPLEKMIDMAEAAGSR